MKCLPLILFTLLFLAYACNNNISTSSQISTPSQKQQANASYLLTYKIQSGDIVLRKGNDMISALFSQLNKKDKSFSHIGMALVTDSGIFVYHIIENKNKQQSKNDIRLSPLKQFIDNKYNTTWAVARYNFNLAQIDKVIKYLHSIALQNITFDRSFDLNTNNKMYCTELIYKTLIQAGIDSNQIPKTYSISKKKYISVDNLYINSLCKIIGRVDY